MLETFKMPDPVPDDPDHNPSFVITVKHFEGFTSIDPRMAQYFHPGYSLVSVTQHDTCIFSAVCVRSIENELSIALKSEVAIAVFAPELTPVRMFVKRGFLRELPEVPLFVIEAIDDEQEKVLITSELIEYDPWNTHEVMGHA